MYHIQARRRPKLRPAPDGTMCPRCGDKHSYRIVGGKEVCNHCGSEMLSPRQYHVELWRVAA